MTLNSPTLNCEMLRRPGNATLRFATLNTVKLFFCWKKVDFFLEANGGEKVASKIDAGVLIRRKTGMLKSTILTSLKMKTTLPATISKTLLEKLSSYDWLMRKYLAGRTCVVGCIFRKVRA